MRRLLLYLAPLVTAGLFLTASTSTGSLVPASFVRNDALYPASDNRALTLSPMDGSIQLSHPAGIASGYTVTYVPRDMMGWGTFWLSTLDRVTVRLDMTNDGSWDHVVVAPNTDLDLIHSFSWNYTVPQYPATQQHTIRWEAVQERRPVTGGAWYHVKTNAGTVTCEVIDVPDITYESNGSTLTGFLSPDGVLDRPLIIVEGYDSRNATFPASYFSRFIPILTSSPLLSAGYDVFVYNYADARITMEQNAMGVLGSMIRLDQDNQGFPARVFGLSMGGVITRYALAWAESNSYSHGCDMFISGDAPQQGAWSNIGFQNFIKDNAHLGGGLAEVANQIDTDAAKQLMRNNVFDPNNGSNPGDEISGNLIYETFYNQLNSLNGDGYPDQTYNIGFSSGHGDIANQYFETSMPTSSLGDPFAHFDFTINIGGNPVHIAQTMGVEEGDMRPGSLQPAFRDPISISNITYGGFLFIDFVRVDVTLETYLNPVFIWASSALDLWGVQEVGSDIVGWQYSKFDEIYAAPSTYFHDEFPPELVGPFVSHLLDCRDAIDIVYPIGGEIHFTNQPVDVVWENCPAYTYTSHTIQFSSDSGSTYAPLATVAGGSTSATVTMPAVISNTCRVRVDSQLADGSVLQYESPADFEVTVGLAGETPANLSGGDLHSISWPDLDNDGILDLCRVVIDNPNTPVELFRGNGDGTFEPLYFSIPIWVDLSNARSVAWADYNNDGWLDFYVGRDGAPNVLFKCLGALPAPTYVEYQDATVPPLDDAGQAKGVSWVDFDNTGRMDIFVANRNSTNKLFRNAGAGVWVDDSAPVAGYASEKTYCGVWADYDEDGDQDLFVTNWGSPDHLYKNNGDRTFNEVWLIPQGNYQSRSANWVDYDNDGDFDVHVVTVYGPDFLWQNQGDGTFQTVGVGLGGTTLEDDFTATWRDVSNFGWLDPWIVTGADDRRYMNNGFQGTPDFTELGGLWHGDGYGRVGVAADYDNDGHMDLYIADTKSGGPSNWLFHNYVVYPNTHWIQFRLQGTRKNRDAIGAVIKITGVNAGSVGTPARVLSGGDGFHSQSPLRLHFGLGGATEVDVQVRWPSGLIQNKHFSTVDQIVTLVEPAVPPPPPTGCPFVYVYDGTEYTESNTILAAVQESQAGTDEADLDDLHVLRTEPRPIDGSYHLQIREFEHERTFLDRAELWVFDHPEGARVVNDLHGGLRLRDEQAIRPAEATFQGEDILDLLEREDGQRFRGQPGDIVELRFLDSEGPSHGSFGASVIPKIPAAPRLAGRPVGIEVFGRDTSSGDFVSLGVLQPRELPSEFVLGDTETPSAYTDLRLAWHTAHELDWFGWTRDLGELPAPEILPLAAATHVDGPGPSARSTTYTGKTLDAEHLLTESDGRHATLSPGEHIELRFDALPTTASGRSFVLHIEGHYVTLPATQLPESIELLDGVPNPFAARTSIGFALPAWGRASIEVFSADGRKVRTLVDENFEAGVHQVEWDGRDDDGRSAPSGTYVYRLTTQDGKETRKLVLLK